MQEDIYSYIDREESFNILNLSLTKESQDISYLRLNSNKDTTVTINSSIYWKSRRDFREVSAPSLFLRVYGKTNSDDVIILDNKKSDIPTLALDGIFIVSEDVTIPWEIVNENDIDLVIIEFSYTEKHEGEMGLEASLAAGVFFRTIISIDNSDLNEKRGE